MGVLASTLHGRWPRGGTVVARRLAEGLARRPEFDMVCLVGRVRDQLDLTFIASDLSTWLANHPLEDPPPVPPRGPLDLLRRALRAGLPPVLHAALARVASLLRRTRAAPPTQPADATAVVRFDDLDAFLCFWFFNDDWWQDPLETFYLLPLGERHPPIVSWFHDAIPVAAPDLERGVKPDDFRRVLSSMARHASFIVCGSAAAANDLRLVRPDAAARARVIPYGHDHDRFSRAGEDIRAGEVRSRYSIAPSLPYFCSLGLYPRHKNVANVLHAARLLRQRAPELPFQLVLMGDARATSALTSLLEDLRSTVRVVLTGRVRQEDLPIVMGNSVALVYASTVEGFGLPPLEAMSSGTLTVCSDLPVLRESCGNHPVYCNPAEPSSIASAMEACLRMARDERTRRSAASLEHARSVSWAAATSKLVRFLVDDVLSSRNAGRTI